MDQRFREVNPDRTQKFVCDGCTNSASQRGVWLEFGEAEQRVRGIEFPFFSSLAARDSGCGQGDLVVVELRHTSAEFLTSEHQKWLPLRVL